MKTKIAPRNRSKKQRTVPNIPFLGLFVITSALVTLGLVGHSDKQYQTMQAMQTACQANPASNTCHTLITVLEHQPNVEVLSDNAGNFWTEVK